MQPVHESTGDGHLDLVTNLTAPRWVVRRTTPPRGRLRRLLYLCEYPPSTMGGAPIIARQLLHDYEPLHMLCCEHMVADVEPVVQASFLDRPMTVIPYRRLLDRRPRRYLNGLSWSLNALRVDLIVREGRRIIEAERIEALLALPWRCEFALAAYRLHLETGLPLYVYEMDDWEAMNPTWLQGRWTARYHGPMLRAAERLWVPSPNMQRTFAHRFGVQSDFLFHFLDPEPYRRAREAARADPERARPERPIRLAYTGSINAMFEDTMQTLCDWLNRGLRIDGRPVELVIYGGRCPPSFRGPAVHYKGLVDKSAIPDVLARADVALVGISFSDDPEIKELVTTSCYTKTIDYLASGLPTLVVGPEYSGEVDYFGDVTTVVPRLDRQAVTEAITRMVRATPEVVARVQAGERLVRKRHSLDAIEPLFLRHFRKA